LYGPADAQRLAATKAPERSKLPKCRCWFFFADIGLYIGIVGDARFDEAFGTVEDREI
jgi:hypothetical protein